jgi:signal transduction histidine kinase
VQQRLVNLQLQLAMARERLREPDGAAALLDGARDELSSTLAELRQLARGLHPAVLTNRGLAAAVRSLAARTPVPARVAGVPSRRLPPAVESAAYFVVAESLTNLAKHAGAGAAVVRLAEADGALVVEVQDDGRGGADPEGSGLRGLAVRVAALDGTLRVTSPPGGGTVVRARIPIPPERAP